MWIWRYILLFLALFFVSLLSQILNFTIGNVVFRREKNWEKDIRWIATISLIGAFAISLVAAIGRILG